MSPPTWAVSGFIIALVVFSLPFSWDSSFDVADVLRITITLFLVLYIDLHVVRKTTDLRIDKNLLVQQVQRALAQLGSIEKEIQECFYSRARPSDKQRDASIIRHFRELSNILSGLESFLGQSPIRLSKIDVNPAKMELFCYKDLVTGGSFPSVSYTSAHLTRIQAGQGLLYRKLAKLIFSINHSR